MGSNEERRDSNMNPFSLCSIKSFIGWATVIELWLRAICSMPACLVRTLTEMERLEKWLVRTKWKWTSGRLVMSDWVSEVTRTKERRLNLNRLCFFRFLSSQMIPSCWIRKMFSIERLDLIQSLGFFPSVPYVPLMVNKFLIQYNHF